MQGDKQWPPQLIKHVWLHVQEGAKEKVAAACVPAAWTAAVSWLFFFPFLSFFSLVCVIMCKVEEKQLEATLSGDGGGRGRNQSTSGLFKLPLASPCPESSAGPRGRPRFLFPASSGGPGSEQKPCRGAHRRAGFVCEASQKKMTEALLSLVDVFNLFPHPEILPHLLTFYVSLCLRLAA